MDEQIPDPEDVPSSEVVHSLPVSQPDATANEPVANGTARVPER